MNIFYEKLDILILLLSKYLYDIKEFQFVKKSVLTILIIRFIFSLYVLSFGKLVIGISIERLAWMESIEQGICIIPSIASADPLDYKNEINRLNGISNLHLDIEDGNFVPNISFGQKTIRRISEYVNGSKELDAHLFVKRPDCWIEELAVCEIKKVAVQIEALDYPLDIIGKIHKRGMKAGLGLNFSSPAEVILPFLPSLDYIVVMTAEPDGMGMVFYPEMLNKIRKLSKYITGEQQIWADGGINETTIESVVSAGAKTIILGRAIFSAADPLCFIHEMANRLYGVKN